MQLSYTDIKDFAIARAHGAALAETDVTTTPAAAAYDAEKMSLDRALGTALSGDAAHASMGEDHLGTGRFVYNQAKTQTAAFEHYPCGARYSASGTAPHHEFTGKPWDPDANLFYFPYRYYRPDMVRWMSPDPMGLIDGPNVYGYVNNRPNFRYDELGLQSCEHPCKGAVDAARDKCAAAAQAASACITGLMACAACVKWCKLPGPWCIATCGGICAAAASTCAYWHYLNGRCQEALRKAYECLAQNRGWRKDECCE